VAGPWHGCWSQQPWVELLLRFHILTLSSALGRDKGAQRGGEGDSEAPVLPLRVWAANDTCIL
jgi:hypothetical protein